MATTVSCPFAPVDTTRPLLLAKPVSSTPSVHRFAFAGTAREYFGIWIVNILLSVVTLGIYSAWAHVRARRYFYGNTLLDGIAFGYHARPMQILTGRLIAVGLFAAYLATATLYPWFDLLASLVILPAVMPWIVARGLRFGRRVSSHRNLRFGFTGSMRKAFDVYVVLTFGVIISAGLLYPESVRQRRRYQIEHSWFGRTDFWFVGGSSGFYMPYFCVVGVAIVSLPLVVGMLSWMGIHLWPVLTQGGSEDPIAVATAALLIAAVFLVAHAFLSTQIENYACNNTLLGDDRFSMDLEFGRMLWLYVSNALAIVASVGLMIPWAQVRLAHYRLSRLSLQTVAGLDRHVAAAPQSVSATGQELGATFDVDIGL
jgi:uncharacterized membrane protein YjgN (DUF898 family)